MLMRRTIGISRESLYLFQDEERQIIRRRFITDEDTNVFKNIVFDLVRGFYDTVSDDLFKTLFTVLLL